MSKLNLSKQQEKLLDKAFEEYKVQESRNNLSAKQQRVFIASQMNSDDVKGQKRQSGEDWQEYKERLKIEKLWDRMKREGKFAWVAVDWQEDSSSGMFMNQGGGTYKKSLYGELEHKQNKIEKRKARNVKRALGKIETQLENK